MVRSEDLTAQKTKEKINSSKMIDNPDNLEMKAQNSFSPSTHAAEWNAIILPNQK
jgi:hypothetical protein